MELSVEYSDGDTAWHPIALVKDQDPQATTQYIMDNNFGKILNAQHRRWARAFLRSLRCTLRRLRRTTFLGYTATTYNPSPKKTRSRRSKLRTEEARVRDAVPFAKCRRTFKYGLEVPKSWKDIMRIDDAAKNTKWQDVVAKEVAALILH